MRADGEHRDRATIKRFDPRFWTVNFPRPMMASVVTSAPDALRVALAFTGRDNLSGLIWEAEDKWDHPLLAYATARDFRGCRMRFRWRSSGVKPLDAVHGPTLTIEGRDASGAPRSWYVRLWNYAVGTPQDAQIDIDFGSVAGGFLHPAEADPVWAGDVDRIMVSLVPPDYDGSAGDYAAMTDAWVELSDMRCDGSGSVLSIGDAMVPTHGLSIATAYDDCYNQTPARIARQIEALGYAGPLLHYVGMSHYPRLAKSGGAWLASLSGGALCEPARAWHAGLAAEAKMREWRLIWSLSYELFADYCPSGWMQRTQDGAAALTGWVPPSALLSPANAEAMFYLALVARSFVVLAKAAGLAVDFQIGEPWWWITQARKICLYDAAASAALGAASVAIADMGAVLNAPQLAMLDAAGAILAGSTAALSAAVRDEAGAGGASVHLLTYLPSVLDPNMPEARRANMPLGWVHPTYDVLQIEDYDWASRGQTGLSDAARAAAAARLGYPPAKTHYLAGFVLNAADRAQWGAIAQAADNSRAADDAATFIWALPQVARDGFTAFPTETGAEAVQPFDDVDFPIALGREAEVVTEFSTAIITGQSGTEQRAPDWDNARMRYDAGPGVRSEDDVQALAAFYRARRGPAIGFRFRDPFDFSVSGQVIGTGDGVRTDFALVKSYGAGVDSAQRRITRPVAASVIVRVGGNVATGWTMEAGGVVRFAVPPASSAEVSADFAFDVPVRFANDRLEVSRATYLAGEVASVPLVEVREV
ncbi:MAG: DUF2460 domain-containing protein [Sphingopyxis sp.]